MFLEKSGLTNKMPCRFDVIGMTECVTDSVDNADERNKKASNVDTVKVLWIKNAF